MGLTCGYFHALCRFSSSTCSGTAVSTTSDRSWTPTFRTTSLERSLTSIKHNSTANTNTANTRLPSASVVVIVVRIHDRRSLILTLLKHCVCRELIRCLKWYMDRSAEVVRQDHIQEAMRVRTMTEIKTHTHTHTDVFLYAAVQKQKQNKKPNQKTCPDSFKVDLLARLKEVANRHV